MSDVLVLNRSFYAVQIADWKRALTLVYLDHAHVVDQEYRTYSFSDWQELSQMTKNHSGGYISTPNFRIMIPEVIALKLYDRLPTTEIKFTRRNIYEHYGYRCVYCGKKFSSSELNLEHVVPKSKGGKTTWDNIVTACVPCNIKKGDKTPEAAGMKLSIKPSKPKWRGGISLAMNSSVKIKASWQRFIDNAYWNLELEKE